jgi:hypothetical protein
MEDTESRITKAPKISPSEILMTMRTLLVHKGPIGPVALIGQALGHDENSSLLREKKSVFKKAALLTFPDDRYAFTPLGMQLTQPGSEMDLRQAIVIAMRNLRPLDSLFNQLEVEPTLTRESIATFLSDRVGLSEPLVSEWTNYAIEVFKMVGLTPTSEDLSILSERRPSPVQALHDPRELSLHSASNDDPDNERFVLRVPLSSLFLEIAFPSKLNRRDSERVRAGLRFAIEQLDAYQHH